MRRKQNRCRTFETILEEVKAENSAKLMKRARLANRLAKAVEGRSRSNAYRVKHSALKALTSRFPDRFYINRDPRRPQFVVVNSLTTPWALHAPNEVFVEHRLRDLAA